MPVRTQPGMKAPRHDKCRSSSIDACQQTLRHEPVAAGPSLLRNAKCVAAVSDHAGNRRWRVEEHQPLEAALIVELPKHRHVSRSDPPVRAPLEHAKVERTAF